MDLRTPCFLPALAAAVALASAPPRPARGAPRRPAAEVVNINTASLSQLRLLPGVGATLAARIVRRRRRRRFRKPRELLRVRGIGRRIYRRLRPHVVVEGPTTLKRKLKRRRKQRRRR